MTRERRNATAEGVPVVDNSTVRARREAARRERQARYIAESIAARAVEREASAMTCETPEQLIASLRASIEATSPDDENPNPPDGAA